MKTKKNKPGQINNKSLQQAQARIAKLRPIRDKLLKDLVKVSGYNGLILRDEIQIFAFNEAAKNEIQAIIDPKYMKYIKVELTKPELKGKKKLHGRPVVKRN